MSMLVSQPICLQISDMEQVHMMMSLQVTARMMINSADRLAMPQKQKKRMKVTNLKRCSEVARNGSAAKAGRMR